MSSLVAERLWAAVRRFRSRLVVISDLPCLYAEADLPEAEAAGAFGPVMDELLSPRRRDAVVLLTGPGSPSGRRRGGSAISLLLTRTSSCAPWSAATASRSGWRGTPRGSRLGRSWVPVPSA